MAAQGGGTVKICLCRNGSIRLTIIWTVYVNCKGAHIHLYGSKTPTILPYSTFFKPTFMWFMVGASPITCWLASRALRARALRALGARQHVIGLGRGWSHWPTIPFLSGWYTSQTSLIIILYPAWDPATFCCFSRIRSYFKPTASSSWRGNALGFPKLQIWDLLEKNLGFRDIDLDLGFVNYEINIF